MDSMTPSNLPIQCQRVHDVFVATALDAIGDEPGVWPTAPRSRSATVARLQTYVIDAFAVKSDFAYTDAGYDAVQDGIVVRLGLACAVALRDAGDAYGSERADEVAGYYAQAVARRMDVEQEHVASAVHVARTLRDLGAVANVLDFGDPIELARLAEANDHPSEDVFAGLLVQAAADLLWALGDEGAEELVGAPEEYAEDEG